MPYHTAMKMGRNMMLRIDPETKDMAVRKAERLGLGSVSAYIRMLIRLDNQRASAEAKRRER